MDIMDFLSYDLVNENVPTRFKDSNIFSFKKISKVGKANLVFYPGGGTDMTPINLFNPSSRIFFYVYCDYLIPLEHIIKNIRYDGYEIIESYDEPLSANILKKYNDHLAKMKISFDIIKPYKRIFVFKKIDKSINGADQFVLVYLGMDAIFVYHHLNALVGGNVIAAFLKDHGFGGNYTTFSNNGLLHQKAIEINRFPKYIITKVNNNFGDGVWDEYSKCEETINYRSSFDEEFGLYLYDYSKNSNKQYKK